MAQEIERKFLLANDSWRPQSARRQNYRQAYLTTGNERSSIRIRVAGEQAYLNIKSATLGISRTEYEYPIPLSDAQQMLEQLCAGSQIDKTRHFINHGRHVWEIDEFHGDNEGLVVAEIELGAEDESFDRPSWLGQEVSTDPRYYNVSLVQHPYQDWE